MREGTHSQEEILVACPTDSIGSEDELPAERARIPQEEGGQELDRDDEEHCVFGPRLMAHELRNLREDMRCRS